jgi:hypothetical protein
MGIPLLFALPGIVTQPLSAAIPQLRVLRGYPGRCVKQKCIARSAFTPFCNNHLSPGFKHFDTGNKSYRWHPVVPTTEREKENAEPFSF